MAEVRPTLTDIHDRMRSDAAAALPGVDVALPRSLFGVLLTAFAGAVHEAWGHLQSIADDAFPDTATTDSLQRWASIWGVTRVQAVQALGLVDFGISSEAPSIEPGRRLVRSDGVEYETTSGLVQSPGGNWIAQARAVVAGADGNYSGTVRLVEPSPGIGDVPILTGSGVDGDTDEELRDRLLDVLQNPPQGGNAADYKRWALEVPALTRAWVMPPVAGSPDFTIYVADDSKAPAAPTPDGPDVTAAQAIVDAEGPVTANPTATAATFEALDAEITITPNTAEIESAVDAEIDAMLIERATPGGTILLSWLQEAVARTPGLTDFTITAPVADVSPAGDNVVYKGTTVFS